MSRSYRYVDYPRKRSVSIYEDVPKYRMMCWAADCNPPSSFRRKWRKELRNRIKQQIQRCKDFDDLCIETRITRLTSVYDWY